MATGLSGMDMLRFAGSLILVFGLLGGLLWGLKRMQAGVRLSGGVRQLEVIEAVSVGPRQKIALVRVGGREVLVGVSPTQLTALGSWPAAALDDSESVHVA